MVMTDRDLAFLSCCCRFLGTRKAIRNKPIRNLAECCSEFAICKSVLFELLVVEVRHFSEVGLNEAFGPRLFEMTADFHQETAKTTRQVLAGHFAIRIFLLRNANTTQINNEQHATRTRSWSHSSRMCTVTLQQR